MQSFICSKKAVATWLVVFLLIYQVSSSPVPEGQPSSTGFSTKTLSRKARMTPLWRSIGIKPHGAYCKDSFECTTKVCREGHCSSYQHFQS
nr:PREDICTED: liver-expressed antimicrobial peptide 2-like [Lepisosteus oculatus]